MNSVVPRSSLSRPLATYLSPDDHSPIRPSRKHQHVTETPDPLRSTLQTSARCGVSPRHPHPTPTALSSAVEPAACSSWNDQKHQRFPFVRGNPSKSWGYSHALCGALLGTITTQWTLSKCHRYRNFCSTWNVMAVLRYLKICHMFQRRVPLAIKFY